MDARLSVSGEAPKSDSVDNSPHMQELTLVAVGTELNPKEPGIDCSFFYVLPLAPFRMRKMSGLELEMEIELLKMLVKDIFLLYLYFQFEF